MWLSTPTTTSNHYFFYYYYYYTLPLYVMTDCHVHSSITYHNKHSLQHALDFLIVVIVVVVVIVYFTIVNNIYIHDIKWNTDEATVTDAAGVETRKKNKQDEEAGIILLIFLIYWQWFIYLRWRSKTINYSIQRYWKVLVK